MIIKNFVHKFINGIAWRYGYEVIDKGGCAQAVGDQYLKRLFKEFNINCVVDIGANAGQFVRRIRNNSLFSGTIHSYEPIPELFSKLEQMSLNDSDWHIFPFAVDAKSGKTIFNIMAGSEFSSILEPSEKFRESFNGQNKVEREIMVNVLSLEDVTNSIFDGTSQIRALLKLDTQGTELRILSSSIDAVKRFDAILVELSFQTLYENSSSAFEVIDWMKAAGFELSSLFANNSGHFPHLLEMDGVFVQNNLLGAYRI